MLAYRDNDRPLLAIAIKELTASLWHVFRRFLPPSRAFSSDQMGFSSEEQTSV